MDFVVRLPRAPQEYDSILGGCWSLDKGHTLHSSKTVKIMYSVAKYAQLYLDEIVKPHRISVSIIFDRGPQFTSRFWEDFQEATGTRVVSSILSTPKQMACWRGLSKH